MTIGIIQGGLPLSSTLRYGAVPVSRIYYGEWLVWPANTILADVGSFTLSGRNAGLLATRRFDVGAGAYVLGAQAAGRIVSTLGGTGAFTLSGQAADLLAQLRLLASAGSYVLTGRDANLRRQVLSAEASAFALTGQGVGLLATRTEPADVGNYVLSGFDAGGVRSYPLAAEVGAFTLGGQNAELVRRVLAANVGAFVLGGQAAILARQLRISADPGSYAITGNAATLTKSGFTLSFHASAVSNAATVTVPATVQAGDVGILVDFIENGATGVTPTGWTQLADAADSTFQRIRVSRKILTGADAGATVTGMSASNNNKVLLVFRGTAAIASVAAGSWNAQATGGDPTSQSVTASGGTPPLVVIGAAAINGGTAAFSTASPAFDATVATANADLLVGYKIYNSAPSDHTIDMNDLGTRNALASGYLACSP